MAERRDGWSAGVDSRKERRGGGAVPPLTVMSWFSRKILQSRVVILEIGLRVTSVVGLGLWEFWEFWELLLLLE